MEACHEESSYRKWAKLTEKQQRSYKEEFYLHSATVLYVKASTELSISNKRVLCQVVEAQEGYSKVR